MVQMKLRILSDLHLEGGEYDYTYKHAGEEVLILAGDIHTRGRHSILLKKVPKDVEIFMVAGNHEYYRGSFDRTNDELKALEEHYPNFHYLLDQSITFKGVDIFGGTMYSDLLLYGFDPLVEIETQHGINDFMWITKNDKGRYRTWRVEDHKTCHEKFCFEFTGWLKRTEGCKRVVITHFVPTEQAIHSQYRMSRLNPYFTSNMEHLMGWEGLWIFGHTHSSYRGKIGDTELICNPKGYGNYENREFIEDLIVEI
jgi:predicted phosphodiesterase